MDHSDNIYNKDALASKHDLESLFEVLSSVRDIEGNPAKFTSNSIMANPDFEKIKQNEYQRYYYETLPDTFSHYPEHHNNLEIWKKGINEGIFQPQFHGREHLNYKRWLKALQNGDREALFCFEWGSTYSGRGDYSFMEAFDWDYPEDVREHKNAIKEGLQLFREYFGFDSLSFIAPCYNWDPSLENTLAANRVKIIQGIRNQQVPTGSFGNYKSIRHKFGEINTSQIIYNIRNCFFEPSMNPNKDWVDSCLAQVNNAFLFNKPAVICSHRVNYIGFIEEKNRETGLRKLKELLISILKKWPDVNFISTDELIPILGNNN